MKTIKSLREEILNSNVSQEEMNYLVDFIGAEQNVVEVRRRLRRFLNNGDPKNEHPIPRSIRDKENKELLPWSSLMELAKETYYSK